MRMKLGHLLLIIFSIISLTACSAVQEVSNGVDYARGATDYINKVLTFKSDVTQFIEQGKFDQATRKSFLPKVEQMKKDVATFESLTPPKIEAIQNIHQQITDFNQVFKPSLDTLTTTLNAETPEITMDQFSHKISQGLDSAKNLQGVLGPLKDFIK
ncbi:MAG TPA: DUF6376 family protein [Bacillota bacterium]|nr:DUF6376 family protein [Bacillota bacterium]